MTDSLDFSDHFSGHAERYARHRPTYPEPLFRWLASLAPACGLAWDCATGNGQCAVALVGHFARVVATDASEKQLAEATPVEGVEYRVEAAERTSLDDGSVDLVTVAQALHWFDVEAFGREFLRVARPGAVLATWSYGRMRVTPEVDRIVGRLMYERLAGDWPPERSHVENGYRDLALPIEPIAAPNFEMTAEWSSRQALDYIGTWSAARRFATREGFDAVEEVESELRRAWGDGLRTVRWPLAFRVGAAARPGATASPARSG